MYLRNGGRERRFFRSTPNDCTWPAHAAVNGSEEFVPLQMSPDMLTESSFHQFNGLITAAPASDICFSATAAFVEEGKSRFFWISSLLRT